LISNKINLTLHQNVIGSRRASWRVLSSIEQQGHEDKKVLIGGYKRTIEKELGLICGEIIKVRTVQCTQSCKLQAVIE
jgi:hypothetical protein